MLFILSLASLGICFLSPFLYLHGHTDQDEYKGILLGATLAYFVFATWWSLRRA
jgi:hypothetical protein